MNARRRAPRRGWALALIALLVTVALSACQSGAPAGDATALIAEARESLDEGRTEDALDAARRAVEADEDSAEAHFVQGNAYAHSDDLARAEASYRRALELDPDHADAHSNLGVIYYRQERLAEAESALRAALERAPDDAEFHYNLGGVLASSERLDEALAEFQRAMELDPTLAEPYLGAGIAYQRLGRSVEAARTLETYLSIADDPEWTATARALLQELEDVP